MHATFRYPKAFDASIYNVVIIFSQFTVFEYKIDLPQAKRYLISNNCRLYIQINTRVAAQLDSQLKQIRKSCISNLGEKKAQRPVSPELIKFRQQRSKFMQKQTSAFLVLHSCVSLVLFSTFSYYFVYDFLQKNTYANDSSQFHSNFNIFMFFMHLNPFPSNWHKYKVSKLQKSYKFNMLL